MKKCKECWKINENPLLKFCLDHSRLNKKIKQSQPKKIGSRTKKRLKENWSEVNTYEKKYNETKICVITWKYVSEPKPWNFAHILNKRDYPHLRNFTNNLALVYWIEEHAEVDRQIAWQNKKEIEQKILNWETITFIKND